MTRLSRLPARYRKQAQPTEDIPGLLCFQLRAAGLPIPEREFRFAPPRRWKYDLVYKDRMLAIECEGAVYAQGRHSRGAGMENDMRKYNRGTILGWKILRYSTGMVKNGEALNDLEKILAV